MMYRRTLSNSFGIIGALEITANVVQLILSICHNFIHKACLHVFSSENRFVNVSCQILLVLPSPCFGPKFENPVARLADCPVFCMHMSSFNIKSFDWQCFLIL